MPAKKKKEEEVKEEVEVLEEEVEQEEVEEEFPEDGLLFDAEGNELLFVGGPTLDQVEQWKSLHGEIFLTEFEDDVFIWRTLKRKEYKEIMKIQGADNFYKEERICDRCVLFPTQYNFIEMGKGKAGVPTLISELVMEKSGFQAKTGAMKL